MCASCRSLAGCGGDSRSSGVSRPQQTGQRQNFLACTNNDDLHRTRMPRSRFRVNGPDRPPSLHDLPRCCPLQTVFLSQVGFWDLKSEAAPEKYLKVLERALSQGLQKLVLLLVPTSVRAFSSSVDVDCRNAACRCRCTSGLGLGSMLRAVGMAAATTQTGHGNEGQAAGCTALGASRDRWSPVTSGCRAFNNLLHAPIRDIDDCNLWRPLLRKYELDDCEPPKLPPAPSDGGHRRKRPKAAAAAQAQRPDAGVGSRREVGAHLRAGLRFPQPGVWRPWRPHWGVSSSFSRFYLFSLILLAWLTDGAHVMARSTPLSDLEGFTLLAPPLNCQEETAGASSQWRPLPDKGRPPFRALLSGVPSWLNCFHKTAVLFRFRTATTSGFRV